MARKRKKSADSTEEVTNSVEVTAEHPESTMLDTAFASVFSDDDRATLGEDMARSLFGVPLPYFSQRYLFWSNVIPAGMSVLLAGVPHTCKTSLAMDFCRLFVEYEGMAAGIHTENKWPDSLPAGIMGDAIKRFAVYPAPILQTAQTIVKDILHKKLPSLPNGERLPLCLFLDSVIGGQGAETTKKIEKEGFIGRSYSEIALELSKWLPVFNKWLGKTASNMFFIYHLKKREEGMFAPGGDSKDFYASYVFFMQHPKTTRKVTNEGYSSFYINCVKNSHGPDGMSMPMTFEWWYEEDGTPRHRFLWPEATVTALLNWMKDDRWKVGARHPLTQLMAPLEQKDGGSKGTLFTFKPIGADKLSLREFGEAIEQDAAFRKELDSVFHIPVRQTTKDYFADIDAKRQAEEEAKKAGKRRRKTKPTESVELPPELPPLPSPDIPPDDVDITPSGEEGADESDPG